MDNNLPPLPQAPAAAHQQQQSYVYPPGVTTMAAQRAAAEAAAKNKQGDEYEEIREQVRRVLYMRYIIYKPFDNMCELLRKS